MQLQTKENIKTNLDIAGSRRFQIKLNAKTFKIMSNLYSDKIRAIIREISCNAQDAHIAAGKKDAPIEVWLPTKEEPYFKVKDTGVGLTEDAMYEIYTNVGESTKEDSNDQTGALGLGTKSPLYYADAFTVESIKDGFKKIYTCFLQDGFPTILKLPAINEELGERYEDVAIPVEECNGVTVIVPTSDIQYFNESASEVYRPFSVKPIIKRYSQHYDNLEYNVLEMGENWMELETGGTTVIRYGNIEYPLNSEMLSNMSYEERRFLSEGFVIDMPLGTLDIVPSREALNYDDRTISNLKLVLNDVLEEAKSKILPMLEEAFDLPLYQCLKKVNEAYQSRKGIYTHREFFKEVGKEFYKSKITEDMDFETSGKINGMRSSFNGYTVNIEFKENTVMYKDTGNVVKTEIVQKYPVRMIENGDFRLCHCSDPDMSIHKIRRVVRDYIRSNPNVRYVLYSDNYKHLIPGIPKELVLDVKGMAPKKLKSTSSADDNSRYIVFYSNGKKEKASFNDMKEMLEDGEKFYWMMDGEQFITGETIPNINSNTSDCFKEYYTYSEFANMYKMYAIAVKTKLVENLPLIYITKRESFLKRKELIKDSGISFGTLFNEKLFRFAKSHKKYLEDFFDISRGTSFNQYMNGSSSNDFNRIVGFVDNFGDDSVEARRIKIMSNKIEAQMAETQMIRSNLKERSKLNKDSLFTFLMAHVTKEMMLEILGKSLSSIEMTYFKKRSLNSDVFQVFLNIFDKDFQEMIKESSRYDVPYYILADASSVKNKALSLFADGVKLDSRILNKKLKELNSYDRIERVVKNKLFKKFLSKKGII